MLGMRFSAGIHCVAAFSFSVFRGDCSSPITSCLQSVSSQSLASVLFLF